MIGHFILKVYFFWRRVQKIPDTFPKWFSIVWFLIVALVAAVLVYSNKDGVFGPNPTDVHKALFYFLGAVLLVPLFKKIKFGNVELERLQERVNRINNDIGALREELNDAS